MIKFIVLDIYPLKIHLYSAVMNVQTLWEEVVKQKSLFVVKFLPLQKIYRIPGDAEFLEENY